ncbi:MAG: universal stress protein [Chloroflexi bacterium]|nr:universal stress protein [Chloroflexota bacterium]
MARRPQPARREPKPLPPPETSVLVPLDGSETSASVLVYAIELADKFRARLVLLNVSPSNGRPQEDAQTRRYLDAIGFGLNAKGIYHTELIARGDPAAEIASAAEAEKCELILMTPHARPDGEATVVGGTAEGVIKTTAVPVLLLRPELVRATLAHWTRPPTFIVGLDGSALAATALEYATSYARRLGSKMLLVNAAEPALPLSGAASYYQSPAQLAMRYLTGIAEELRKGGMEVECDVKVGSAEKEIVEAADREDSAIIALSTRGLSGHKDWVLGSITDRVVRSARHPVLVIPPKAAEAAS